MNAKMSRLFGDIMVVETEVQIMRQIKLKITDEDTDGFIENLEDLFTQKQPEMNQEPHLSQAKNIFGTLHKVWLEIQQNT